MGADDSPSTESNTTARNPFKTTLNLAKDGVLLAKPAVSAGFGIASLCVDASFALPKKCTSPYFLLKSPVDLAHSITQKSLRFSSMVAQSSLGASERVLCMAGAENGETYRLLKGYVDSMSHKDGHDKREALLGAAALLVEAGLEIKNPLRLIQGAQKLAILHEQQRQARIARRQQQHARTTYSDWTSSLYMQYATAIYGAQAACCCGFENLQEIIIPHPSDLTCLSRHMRFAAAAYGAPSLKFMGICNDSLTYWTSDIDAIVYLCSVRKEDILLMQQERHELYQPAHFVCVDHINKELVVAIRGTMSMHDVLVDLACHNVVFEADDATIGSVHGGFLKSAQTLANNLQELVMETLHKYPSYQLVVVGHSLGGGVASLLALLWARLPELRKNNVRAISYAAPCVVSQEISQLPFTRRHVTSVVTGDDIVSRFGLCTFRELQRNMIALANEEQDENGSSDNDTDKYVPPADNDNSDKNKLYCAGRVWWLESKEYEPHPIVEVDPVETLYEIGLFPDMFSIHMPKAYLDSLDKLDRRQNDSDSAEAS